MDAANSTQGLTYEEWLESDPQFLAVLSDRAQDIAAEIGVGADEADRAYDRVIDKRRNESGRWPLGVWRGIMLMDIRRTIWGQVKHPPKRRIKTVPLRVTDLLKRCGSEDEPVDPTEALELYLDIDDGLASDTAATIMRHVPEIMDAMDRGKKVSLVSLLEQKLDIEKRAAQVRVNRLLEARPRSSDEATR